MTVQDYITELNKQKDQAEGRFDSLGKFERSIVDSSFQYLLDNIDTKNGNFVLPPNLPQLMDSFVLSIVSVIKNDVTYQTKFANYLRDLNTIKNNIADFQSASSDIDINTKGVKDVQKIVIGEITKQYLGNGLNANFVTPLRNVMYNNLLMGASIKDNRQYLQNYILGGNDQSGKLGSYLQQTAQQGVSLYTGAINMQLGKEFDFTGYMISGSLIKTSSTQCRYAIDHSEGGYMDFKEWQKVLDIARNNPKARLIPGTTIQNLPLNKLHWGCRHDFSPMIKN